MIAKHVRDARNAPVAPLELVLAYRNPLVTYGFTKRFAIASDEAEKIFVEMLRWLWYLGSSEPTADNPEAHAIDDPLLVIDEMWHEFILVTQDYTHFCIEMFGRYIHHRPNGPEEDRAELENSIDVKNALAALLARKRAKYEAIYDRLGKETFVTWYRTFPERYDARALAALRRR
jgi:hypothetical protein